MPTCRALIFDFDGVIVESEHIKARAFRVMYREHGEAVADAAVAHHAANGGISRRQKIRHLHRTLLDTELGEAELEALCRRFSLLVEDEVVACEGVPGALDVLGAQYRRRPMFVVSATPQAELERIVARRGLERWFSEIWGSPPEKAPIVRDILARHRLAPGEVLFIGDALADWRAARECGLRFLGRIAEGKPSVFPPGTPLVRDLTQLVI